MRPLPGARAVDAETARQAVAGTALPAAPDVPAAAEAAVEEWRRKAAHVVLIAVAVAHLPVIVPGVLGHGPPMGPLPKTVGLAVYLAVAAAALFRGVEYRRRVVASLLAVYLAFALASLVTPHGPYAQIGLVTTPIYAFVLLGSRAARVAVVASTAIIVSVPLLREQPAVVHLLGFDPALEVDPLSVVWYRVAVKTLSLLALMVLVDRFHGVLRDALIARIVAQRKTEREMRERQRLEREIAGVSDRERRRLGQDLHDGVCQQVTAALLRCQALERRLHRGGTLSEADFEPLASVLAQAIDEAHGVARGLSPLEPDPEALAPALRALARRMQDTAGLRCEFTSAGDVRVADPQAAQHLYRIAQEALSNAVRHAKASRILVEFRGSDSELTLHVEDDGAGMPPERRAGGMGLRTMAYRAQLLEGGLIVAPAPGGGTRVTCRVPRSAGGLAVQQGSGGDRWMPAT